MFAFSCLWVCVVVFSVRVRLLCFFVFCVLVVGWFYLAVSCFAWLSVFLCFVCLCACVCVL